MNIYTQVLDKTHTSGSGKTLKTEQLSGPDGTTTTMFEYDGIRRLVRVTDTDGNVTSKQTANLAKEGKSITYDYEYNRLTGINYPDHPDNNVKYYYGGRNASQNRVGRLMLREDGTGAME